MTSEERTEENIWEPEGKTCCFTGHRPPHLPWRNRENAMQALSCRAMLADAIEAAWKQGYRRFLCGMAQGADLMFAEAVLACRMVHPEVTLTAVIPCEDQTEGWKPEEIRRYQDILQVIGPKNCILVQQKRTKGCMLRRDRYMVNHARRVIALYDGKSRGGTQYTLGYALQKQLEYVIIDPEELSVQVGPEVSAKQSRPEAE